MKTDAEYLGADVLAGPDVDDLVRDVGFSPRTTFVEGVGGFVDWYREYYQI